MPETKDALDDRVLGVVAQVNIVLLGYRQSLKAVAQAMGHASLFISASPTEVYRDEDVTRLRELLTFEQANLNGIMHRLEVEALGLDK